MDWREEAHLGVSRCNAESWLAMRTWDTQEQLLITGLFIGGQEWFLCLWGGSQGLWDKVCGAVYHWPGQECWKMLHLLTQGLQSDGRTLQDQTRSIRVRRSY